MQRLLEASSPRTRALVRLALRAIEWAAPPRRLSRLTQQQAAAALGKLAASRISLRRELFLSLKTLVTLVYASDQRVLEAVGVRSTCAVADSDGSPSPAPRAPSLRTATLHPVSPVEHCDVVIVGSGAGGASAARVLAEQGIDVIVLERGAYHDAEDYSTDPLAALPMLYRDAGLTFCEGRPHIPMPVGQAVGGTTVINSGTCLRTPREVLERWREEFGIEWASALDDDFEAIERTLEVRTLDARAAGRNGTLCRDGASALGFANGPLPRNAGAVCRCSACPTGCVLDAKRAMHVSELPRALAAGARLRAGQRVTQILTERGRAVGVRADGYEVRARAVLLAAGALGTPELLLAQGLANSSGAVGRHLRIHPACWVGARFEEPVRGWEGVMQSWAVEEFSERGLFFEATATPLAFGAQGLPGTGAELQRRIADYGHVAVIGVHLSERSQGRVRLRGEHASVTYRLGRADARTLRFGIARAAEIHFAAGASEVYPQLGRIARLAPGEAPRIERGAARASQLRLEAFHPMGTARMGADRRSCVVAPSGESHDVPGLYVADASLFPTSLKVNPMLTIMVCARQIAAGLAERLR
ncbi:MAG TPA: GMC family oxidoreductase [Solirubrobacteraceae bacterium]